MTNKSLLPCMVKKSTLQKKKKYKQGTTSLDSFANRSSGCHKVRCSAPYLLRTEICETPSGWRRPGQQPCITSYKRRTRLFLPFHPPPPPTRHYALPPHPRATSLTLFIRLHVCTLSSLSDELRLGGERGGLGGESELNAVLKGVSQLCLIFQKPNPPSQHPQATNEKMETAFCLERAA